MLPSRITSALFDEAPTPKVKLRRNSDGLFSEFISGDKLYQKMQERRYDIAKLAKKSGVSAPSIRKYLSDSAIPITSKCLDKLAEALRCSPLDLIPEKPVEIEKVVPLPEKPKVIDLRDFPAPTFNENAVYIFRRKSPRCDRNLTETLSSPFRYVGTHKGKGVTHYMFRSTLGKYLLTFTDLDFKCGAVTATPLEEARKPRKKR